MEDNVEARPPRTERRDATENRQRILQAARKLFAQHDVEHVSMNQIATEAQIGPGTLYRRYRNKSDLCLELIKDNILLLCEEIESYLREHRSTPPEQRLLDIIRMRVRFMEQKAQLLAGLEASDFPHHQGQQSQHPLYVKLHALLVELFDEMAGAEHSTISIFRADMLMNAARIEFYLFQRDVRGYTSEQIADFLYATFITPG
jgi:AcrR family transcriptional regulator